MEQFHIRGQELFQHHFVFMGGFLMAGYSVGGYFARCFAMEGSPSPGRAVLAVSSHRYARVWTTRMSDKEKCKINF